MNSACSWLTGARRSDLVEFPELPVLITGNAAFFNFDQNGCSEALFPFRDARAERPPRQ